METIVSNFGFNPDIQLSFKTKAETLADLSMVIQSARILPIVFFSKKQWDLEKETLLRQLEQDHWFTKKLIVRSSAQSEDTETQSMAGRFISVLNVQGKNAICDAINQVFDSYGASSVDDQVLLQPMLADVISSGVAFSHDPNTGGEYIVINYDDSTGSTETVTSGCTNHLKCYIHHHRSHVQPPLFLREVVALTTELLSYFNHKPIDFEFAYTKEKQLYLFQVRSLILKQNTEMDRKAHYDAVERISHRLQINTGSHPYLYGSRTVYGVMPDWNPAEIIGIRPHQLALTLYRELITDTTWAYQRDNYGYRNLRSFPLLIDFEGLPYIDVRVSFNSFIPKLLSDDLAEKLVNYYIDRLIKQPALHDKVEFDIVYSCYTLGLRDRLNELNAYGFSSEECDQIAHSLTKLTNEIIHNDKGLWKKDLDKVYELEKRQHFLALSDLDPVSKMYWMVEDCKRYGTLPFAGLARAGFIAVQILRSFVQANILNQEEYTAFIGSVESVSSKMASDFNQLDRAEFLAQYGHLRPGTYDILSPRYDEAPDRYFNWARKTNMAVSNTKHATFALSISQLRLIQAHIDQDGLEIDVLGLLEFIKHAIESREYAKFIFTRSVSDLLKMVVDFGKQYGFNKEQCAHLDIKDLLGLYSSSSDPQQVLADSIRIGEMRRAIASTITLPSLMVIPEDAWSFYVASSEPNYITQKRAEGVVVFSDSDQALLSGAILMIPSADPGFDWIFSHPIKGFITKYGGVNSHMAIRAGELGIPAVIGAGETLYDQWKQAKQLEIDCLNRQVKILI